jgi:hypothetical protein
MRYWNPLLITVCAASLLVVPALAHSQWKWRDKSGKIQYSDLPPPPDVLDANILARPPISKPPTFTSKPLGSAPAASGASAAGSASAPASPASKASDAEEAKRKKAEQDAIAAKRKADEERVAAEKSSNCKSARNNLKALEDGLRVSRTNEKGEREVLEDKGRAQEMQRAREIISKDCS